MYDEALGETQPERLAVVWLLPLLECQYLEQFNFPEDWIFSATRPIEAIICLGNTHHYFPLLTDADLKIAIRDNDLILYLHHTY